jgi:TRAP-type mannitol/chloroaromatic compound transport system permease large subunit
MRDELDIQTLQTAKANATAFYHADDTDKEFWEQVVEDIDEEIVAISQQEKKQNTKAMIMLVIITILVLATIILTICCQTVKGVTGDAGWMLTKLSDNIQTEGK